MRSLRNNLTEVYTITHNLFSVSFKTIKHSSNTVNMMVPVWTSADVAPFRTIMPPVIVMSLPQHADYVYDAVKWLIQ